MKKHFRIFVLILSIITGTDLIIAQWVRTKSPSSEPVNCLAIKDSSLFAGTSGSGVFLSPNNGANWTAVNNNLSNHFIQTLTFKGSHLFAGTDGGGIFLSTDNGLSWSTANNGLTNSDVRSIATDGNNLFAGTDGGGVFLSTNDGANWSPINTGLNVQFVFFVLAVVPDSTATNGHSVFAGTNIGAFRSTNNGTNWSYASNGLTSPWPTTCVYSFATHLTAGGSGVSDLFAATNGGVFHSSNYGTNWTAVNNGLSTTSVPSVIASDINLFSGTYGGVFLSTNTGTSWTALKNGLTDTLITSLAISGTTLFAGTLNGAVWYRSLIVPTLESLSFGAVTRDSIKSLTVTLRNTSQDTVSIGSINTGSIQFHSSYLAKAIEPNDTLNITIHFTPNSYGSFEDTLFLQSSFFVTSEKIPMRGESPPPLIAVAPPTLTFGPVALADTVICTITIYNKSLVNKLTISQLDHHTPVFMINSSLPIVIGANDSTSITIKFNVASVAPEGYGTWLDTMAITSDGGNPTIALIGLSPRPTLRLNPRNVSFGQVGTYDSLKIPLKITNSSPNTLSIDSIYSLTTAFQPSISSLSVRHNDTLGLTVCFKPTQSGSYADTLFLRNNSDTSLFRVPLSGNSPVSSIVIIPSPISFGNVKKDTTVWSLFRITNNSVSPLRIDTLGTKTKYFGVPRILAFNTIKKGDTISVSISFKPDSSRQFNDTLYVANNSTVSPFKIPLNGNGTATSVFSNDNDVPAEYALYQNYPNPLNPSTTFSFTIPTKMFVLLKIFDLVGREVATLISETLDSGHHTRQWNATDLSTGVYFYRLQVGTFMETKKLILLR